jgi:hypothetical protein
MSFWEKITYYKDQLNKRYAPFVDKLVAKQIVKHICGDRIQVAPLVRVLESPQDVQETDLQPNYMIKASHGCGWNVNVQSTTTVAEVKALLQQWNTVYHGINTGEPQYSFLKPRFFIEEKINDVENGISGTAQTFMIRCIQGKAVTIGVRRGDIQNTYDMFWRPLTPELFSMKQPRCFSRMIYLAETLAAPFEFVRVDFYVTAENTIVFSEYTFSPAGGTQIYSHEVEKRLGALWR